ncbi:YheT family hydrolase [Cochleicola gelatinilyticus]|uniref:Alpha/beta hydrolase n=1 Tax=Cochleicola gelatinilyticus TaxID=1763537 RepID=A0A167J685_9FLAO|nr:alpha/beta fold hydrolase [Cochleicola gelatinilyticus]OAB80368.1 alpha/beta hydrolase [Cochleicola gelatinilyticus]
MPLITSPYRAKGLFKNPHFSTIYSAKLRPTPPIVQKRERLELPDTDFLDIDWSFSKTKSNKLAILLHGLEGSASRAYIKGQAKALLDDGWDVAAMNHRGCSGEENRLFLSYNSGRTDDLHFLITQVLKKNVYTKIALIGFSLGGNLVLKYLGERQTLPKEIYKGIAISAPLSLKGSLQSLEKRKNWVYRNSFLLNLRAKYKRKMEHHPDKMTASELKQINSLLQFDTLYTAPAHGFKDAYDYYEKSSSLQYLNSITTPVLILNALNDTFLSPECYPYDLAKNSKFVYLETPKYGGHVAFHVSNSLYYSEKRTVTFLNTSH